MQNKSDDENILIYCYVSIFRESIFSNVLCLSEDKTGFSLDLKIFFYYSKVYLALIKNCSFII